MSGAEEKLQAVLEGYSDFLRDSTTPLCKEYGEDISALDSEVSRVSQACRLAREPTAANLRASLIRLAMLDKVSAAISNQAFRALLLPYREVLRKDSEEMAQSIRAKRG